MSDESNSNGRFDRIEANLEALTEQNKILGERVAALLGAQADTQNKLDYVIRLAAVFGDKIYEFDEKVKRVKEAL